MDIFIWKELHFFWISILYGAGILLFYDLFRIFRRLIKHNNFWIAVEDLIFWLITGVIIFFLLYTYNSGNIRGYCILGMLIGMLLYSKAVSKYLVNAFVTVGEFVLKYLEKIFYPLIKIRKRIKIFLKNKLKKNIETVKIAIRGK